MSDQTQSEAYIDSNTNYDASDPKKVNEARKKAGRQKKQRLDMIAGIMELKVGRAWLQERLSVDCHIYAPSHVIGDPYQTAFRDGERHIGLKLLEDIMTAAPERFMLMCKEAKQNEE